MNHETFSPFEKGDEGGFDDLSKNEFFAQSNYGGEFIFAFRYCILSFKLLAIFSLRSLRSLR
jgi:hypothetical protein